LREHDIVKGKESNFAWKVIYLRHRFLSERQKQEHPT
jgi:hypothetical protein